MNNYKTLFSIETEEQVEKLKKPMFCIGKKGKIKCLLALEDVKDYLMSLVNDKKKIVIDEMKGSFTYTVYGKGGTFDYDLYTFEGKKAKGQEMLEEGLHNLRR